MRLNSRSPEVDPWTAALVRILRSFPDPLPAAVAAELLPVVDPGAQETCARFVDRRIAHVLQAAFRNTGISVASDLSLAQNVIDAISECHWAELATLSAAFEEEGIDFQIPKGLFFPAAVYPDLPRPFSGDLDVLVRLGDFDRARKIVEGLGYRQGLVVRKNAPVQLPVGQVAILAASPWFHGQTPAYTRLVRAPFLDRHIDFVRRMFPFHVVVASGHAYLRPAIDLHYSLNSLAEDTGRHERPDESVWWADAQTVRFGDGSFPAPSDLTVSWFAAHHLYTDAMLYGDVSWKLVADLVAFVRAGRVDFPALASLAHEYGALRPALYFTYRALAALFGLDVPEDFLRATAAASRAQASDLGDLLPVLLGVRCEFALEEGR